MSSRRELLKFGLATGLTGLAASSVEAEAAILLTPEGLAAAASPKVLAVQNLHTGEKIEACYWENGKFVPDACAALNKVLRDHRSGDVHMMDPRLYDILSSVAGKLGRRPTFQIISGYRSARTNAMLQKAGGGGVATGSLHMDGKAMDVRLPGVALADLHKAALSLKRGGVGYYPVSNFVHVDTGRVRQWKGA